MYHIIVNPVSGSGRGARIWSELEPILKEKEVSYQLHISQKAGQAVEIVRKLSVPQDDSDASGLLKLIVLGGDGTLNEVLQGISDFDKVQIGCIPTGSSNDLARDLGLSGEPAAVLENILSCKQAVRMDIGCVAFERALAELSGRHTEMLLSKRYFAVSSGIGFDAAVCEEALYSGFKNILNRIHLGKLTYLVIALKQLIAARKISCDILLDDGEPIHVDRFLFVTGMIHQYEGGGFRFCPDADYHDGLLDICAVGNIPKLLVLITLPTGFTGNHYFLKGINRYFSRQLKLTVSEPLWVHTDGEVSVKADVITMSCEKDKLQLLI